MKIAMKWAFIAILLTTVISIAEARRGNPITSYGPTLNFYIVDSDDNDPRTPTYNFTDTSFGTWTRIQNSSFTNLDNGYANLNPSDTFGFNFMGIRARVLPKFITTNGVLFMDTALTPANNRMLPITGQGYRAFVAALWADMEMRTTGDSSKVYYRMTNDTCYVSYYNLFLKNTNGKVRATFQVVFAAGDSSVTVHYKSFDGNMSGVPAAWIFQHQATIGAQSYTGSNASVYLDRGTYYARSYGSSQYEQDLHNGLAVKFNRTKQNRFRLVSIVHPPNDGYELTNNQFRPIARMENLTDQDRMFYVSYKITNLATGSQIYNRLDSVEVGFADVRNDTGSLYSGFPCGAYRLTVSVTVPRLGTDGWVGDDIMNRDFVYVNGATFPINEDFASISRCAWVSQGSTLDSSHLVFFDPPAPLNTQSLILNRADANGRKYLVPGAGDTLSSGPMDLSAQSNVWLTFSYQRGAKYDSMQAGITNRVLSGPEHVVTAGASGIVQGDSLVVEVLQSSGAAYNPSPSSWVRIAAIHGGHDYEIRKFRMQIPSTYLHNHFRIRFRVSGDNNAAMYGLPFEDNDNFVLDAIQVANPVLGRKNETDLEPTGLDLGAGWFTHIPRDVKNIVPKVRIASNGLTVNQTVYIARLIVHDAIGREVYHRVQGFVAPGAHTDTVLSMPIWNVEGTQGGVLKGTVSVEQCFTDYKTNNDVNVFYRTLYIDDTYGLDDGGADTSGTMTEALAAEDWFYYKFSPMKSDSLRGFEFFHLAQAGNVNWTIHFFDLGGNLLATRSVSYNATQRGWFRSTFTPFYTAAGTTYRMQFIMSQGSKFGGDAARGLVWKTNIASGNMLYGALYPSIDSSFQTKQGVPYFLNNFAVNGDAGGPILPMMRIIYAGSATYLPVELVAFDAARLGNGDVTLNFRTAKESNLRSFEIERQTVDGWSPVASITGKNSSNGASYSSLDVEAPFTASTYRLWETDLDGSRTVIGTTTAAPFGRSEELTLSAYPNPASSQLVLSVGGVSGSASLRIYDALGKQVFLRENILGGKTEIDMLSFADGTYYLELTDGISSVREKVIVKK